MSTGVWPRGMARGGTGALELQGSGGPGDTITGEVRVLKVREDKPITELATRVLRDDQTVVLDGTAVCYTIPFPARRT